MKCFLVLTAGFFLSNCAFAAQDQQQPAAAQTSPTIRATSQEVVLDMVFRDKKGRTVRDIRPEEVHISEEGAVQQLKSFRMIEGKVARPLESGESPASVKPMPLDPLREIRLVTLVFEGLDNDGKRFFRQAVKDILSSAPEQNLYYALFTIDQRLQCIQPFTSDHDELMKSIERSAMWSFTQYTNQSAAVKEALAQVIAKPEPQLQGGQAGGPSAAQVGDFVSYQMAKMQYEMLRAAEAADREYNIRSTLSALQALVQEESKLPGRKVVLYFNPWFRISETVKEQYENLKSAANRGNISFYTVDTKGLTMSVDESGLVTGGQGAGGRQSLANAAANARSQQGMRAGAVQPWQVRAAEDAANSIRDNPVGWLRDLADSTGGAAIVETNDYRAPLRTAMDEVRTYYEATYTPQIDTYDGRFRKIVVTVDRPDVVVHTRNGYFAVPMLAGGQHLASFEMPLLNALSVATAPADVTFQAAAERFNDRGPNLEYMVVVEAPLNGLTFEPQPDNKTAIVNATLLAIVRDATGEIVQKFSKEFNVQVDADKVEAYKAGNLLQTFRAELAPGAYTLETAVMDRKANKIGVKKSALKVPAASTKLSLSDIVVVRRADALKDNEILDAFYFPGGKVVPTLADTLKGGPGNVLPFYFSVYVDPAVQTAPKLTMSFYKEGQFLGAAEAPLPAPEKSGRIPYIANLPADRFAPGNYEIKVGVAQGGETAEQKIDFKVN